MILSKQKLDWVSLNLTFISLKCYFNRVQLALPNLGLTWAWPGPDLGINLEVKRFTKGKLVVNDYRGVMKDHHGEYMFPFAILEMRSESKQRK